MSGKDIFPIPQSAPAEWLSENEELYLPELTDEKYLISRRASKDKNGNKGGATSDTSTRWRRADKGQEGVGWEDAGTMEIIKVDELQRWTEVIEGALGPATVRMPIPNRNPAAEAEAKACGRALGKRSHHAPYGSKSVKKSKKAGKPGIPMTADEADNGMGELV